MFVSAVRSAPSTGRRVEPAAAVDARRRRNQTSDFVPVQPARPGALRPTREPVLISRAEVVAQAVFHAAPDVAEERSVRHADRAYRRSDEIRFRNTSLLSRVA